MKIKKLKSWKNKIIIKEQYLMNIKEYNKKIEYKALLVICHKKNQMENLVVQRKPSINQKMTVVKIHLSKYSLKKQVWSTTNKNK